MDFLSEPHLGMPRSVGLAPVDARARLSLYSRLFPKRPVRETSATKPLPAGSATSPARFHRSRAVPVSSEGKREFSSKSKNCAEKFGSGAGLSV
jgi:hypothetical protein